MRAVVCSVLALLVVVAPALADWDPGQSHKWVQLPDLSPMGCDVNSTNPYLLADDFLCTATGPITDIHLWGSWYHDYLPFGMDPTAVLFTLSIHADIPAWESPTGYSMPGAVLWWRQFEPGEFAARLYQPGLEEGWIEPPDIYEPLGDTQCWQYNFFIDPGQAFIQEGSTVTPVVYWLDVQAQPLDQSAHFGWKTSVDHWNDDATWAYGPEPYQGGWNELRYPLGHPYFPESIDLAFVITTEETQEDLDFGDAPDPTYPTLLANDGARHVLVPGIQLGPQIDWEPDGQPTIPADGDDLNGLADEDGVAFIGPLPQGGLAQVNVTASVAGFLDAWVDFNGDGDWADANEQVFAGQLLNAGGNPLFFSVPLSARPGPTYARFRFSTQGAASLSYTGLAPDGEVEDYLVHIEGQEWKWIQMPDLGETGIDVNATQPFVLADDYLCEAPGRVNEIYIWGSWLNDYLPFGYDPMAVDFILSIHADIPADTAAGILHSMPGEVLWVHGFPAGSFNANVYEYQILEGWMDPPDLYVFPADWTCWLYSFYIPTDEAFHQVGMPDSAIVYWLDVQAIPHDMESRFGWKTSLDHWNDDAVWGLGMEPYMGPWQELRYPPQHVMFPRSIDLAFALRSTAGTDVPEGAAPQPYGLFQNVPNPFNPKTSVSYQVPDGGGHIAVEVYDVNGRHVRTLVDGFQSQGLKSIEWDGTDDDGRPMATGVYFYRMSGPGVESSRKMLLLK